MKYATFSTEVHEAKTVDLPHSVCEKLRLEPGDRVEVSIKKIKSGRLDLMLSENPLYRLMDISHSPSSGVDEQTL